MFGLWTREYCNQGLSKDPSRRFCAESHVLCQGLAQEEGKQGLRSNWAASHSCDVLAKNVAVFCPCPKNFFEANLKSKGLGRGEFKNLMLKTLSRSYLVVLHRQKQTVQFEEIKHSDIKCLIV